MCMSLDMYCTSTLQYINTKNTLIHTLKHLFNSLKTWILLLLFWFISNAQENRGQGCVQATIVPLHKTVWTQPSWWNWKGSLTCVYNGGNIPFCLKYFITRLRGQDQTRKYAPQTIIPSPLNFTVATKHFSRFSSHLPNVIHQISGEMTLDFYAYAQLKSPSQKALCWSCFQNHFDPL